jgi:hypothetical protein
MSMRRASLRLGWCALPALSALTWLPPSAQAQPLPADALERRCWLSTTAERSTPDLREPTSVRFVNLRNGYRLRSPFWVEFGIRGMGVIPAGNRSDAAGHHHILVDTPLPKHHQAAIPFSDKHKHFGKGQTGTLLDLPPGKHTLRLLFADHEHKPYFVFSPEISIEVTGPRSAARLPIDPAQFEASCAAWYQDQQGAPRGTPGTREVYVKNLREGETVVSPFLLSLGALGFGVAPAGTQIAETGHFALQISQGGQRLRQQVLADGRTELVLDLPRGDYELGLSLLDGQGQTLIKGAPLRFSVSRQER